MLFEIDIDETIASGAQAFARYYLTQLELEIDEQVLCRIANYEDVMRLPALVQYCRVSETNMAHFETIQQQARYCPEVFQSFEVIPGALEGLQYLANWGTVRYNTVRPPEIQEATRHWLAANGFVNASNVVFSRSSIHKLLQISAYEGTSLLIDDRYAQVLKGFEQIASENQDVAELLRTRLTLIAFGMRELPAQSTQLRTITLPSWQLLKERITSCLRPSVQNASLSPTPLPHKLS